MFNRLFNRVQVFIISFMLVAYVVLNHDRMATVTILIGSVIGVIALAMTILKREWPIGE